MLIWWGLHKGQESSNEHRHDMIVLKYRSQHIYKHFFVHILHFFLVNKLLTNSVWSFAYDSFIIKMILKCLITYLCWHMKSHISEYTICTDILNLHSLTSNGFIRSWYTAGWKGWVDRQLCLPVRIIFYETNTIWALYVRISLERVVLILAMAITVAKCDVLWHLLRGAPVILPKASLLND